MSTIRKVAEKSGVSVATVSRVLNNNGYVKEETKKKVMETIRELDYVPNSIAKTLYTKKSDTIGLLVPDISNPFFAELYKKIEIAAEKHHQHIFLFNSNYDHSREIKFLSLLNSKLIDSAIIISDTIQETDFKNTSIPIVSLDKKISDKISSVTIDNFVGGQMAVKYLVDKGCSKIAHISGPVDNDMASWRKEGFISESKKNKIDNLVVQGVYDVKETVKIATDLLNQISDIDGIFAGNDIIAVGVIKALSKNLTTKKISLIGFDGIKLGEDITPEITTLSQPIEKIADDAIDIIMKNKKAKHKVYTPKLIVRET